MANLIWSFFERVTPRAAGALVLLFAAASMAPESLGIYNWAVVVLLGVQSIFDSAVRQFSVAALGSRGGAKFFRKYSLLAGLLGPFAVLIGVIVLGAVVLQIDAASMLLAAPLALIPLSNAIATRSVAVLQVAGRWRTLARAQLTAAVASLAFSLPILVLSQSVVGAVVQAILLELFSAAIVIWKASKLRSAVVTYPMADRDLWSEFRGAAVFSTLGWLQSQADRLAISIFAGSAALAIYSLAWTLGRTLGDVMGVAIVNVLRPRLIHLAKARAEEMRGAIHGTLLMAGVACSAGFVLVSLVATFVVPNLLGTEWDAVAQSVPILAASSLPVVYTWVMSASVAVRGNLRSLVPARLLGVAVSAGVGLVATRNIEIAAWVALCREVIVAFAMSFIFWPDVPRRAFTVYSGLFMASSAIALAITVS